MARDALVLGNSTKRGDSRMRGHFGEGFKLAWLALVSVLTVPASTVAQISQHAKAEQGGHAHGEVAGAVPDQRHHQAGPHAVCR